MVTNELLETKFFIPSSKSNLVKRDRLVKYLDGGTKKKLTLISAPAGFGKTTLLAEWLERTELSHTWLSLDQRDNDPIGFWTYFVGALRKIQPQLGEAATAILRSPETDFEFFLTSLLNEISTLETRILLVLDDYHAIAAKQIHQAIAFLLNHLPPFVHLVIASRSDPPLPLARLRARGDLSELRASELRFTAGEAELFAREVMKLNLSEEQVESLQTKVEGWIAGLQMASLSLKQCSNTSTWIDSLQGNQRYIWDYLTEEVLERQPDCLKSFLLKTSILDRLCGSLCDAVLQQENSTETLNYLDRINLFVISLDDKRYWYRYHHLFGELLRCYLQKQESDRVSQYHRRAARWYEQHQLIDEAFKHALAAKDWELAADLVEKEACKLLIDADLATLLTRLEAIPHEIICLRPWLCVYYAWTLWFTAGDIAGARQYLQDAENAAKAKAISNSQPSWTNHPLANEIDEFWANIAALRSYLSHEQNTSEAIRLAEDALKIVPQHNYWLRSLVIMNLGFSYYLLDEWERSEPILAEAKKISFRCDRVDKVNPAFIGRVAESAINSLCLQAEIKELRGELGEAISLASEALELATQRHWLETAPGLFTQAILGKLLWQQNRLEEATKYLTQSRDRSSPLKKSLFSTIRYIYLALIRQAQGNTSAAWEAIVIAEETERARNKGFNFELPSFLSLDLAKVRLWLARGDIDLAEVWAQSQQLNIEDELSYKYELHYLTFARILIAQKSWKSAMFLLGRLQQITESKKRISRVIEILILQSLIYRAENKLEASLQCIERALFLARSRGYFRLFLDEGEPTIELLRQAASRKIHPKYINNLLEACGKTPTSESSRIEVLIEPLSDRELEILQNIATGLTNQDIADRLFISLATVKWHTSNIYSKLEVRNRNQAVVRARELKILA